MNTVCDITRGAEVVQEWCTGGAEVVQAWCTGGAGAKIQ